MAWHGFRLNVDVDVSHKSGWRCHLQTNQTYAKMDRVRERGGIEYTECRRNTGRNATAIMIANEDVDGENLYVVLNESYLELMVGLI